MLLSLALATASLCADVYAYLAPSGGLTPDLRHNSVAVVCTDGTQHALRAPDPVDRTPEALSLADFTLTTVGVASGALTELNPAVGSVIGGPAAVLVPVGKWLVIDHIRRHPDPAVCTAGLQVANGVHAGFIAVAAASFVVPVAGAVTAGLLAFDIVPRWTYQGSHRACYAPGRVTGAGEVRLQQGRVIDVR